MTTFQHVLSTARAQRLGIGAFNVVLLEHAEAIVEGAESAERPVVLQISENCIDYHGSTKPILAACQSLARDSRIEVFVHLDHIKRLDLIEDALEFGVDSVMYDGSHLPYGDNVRETARIAALCHSAGTSLEAELGEIGGKDGVHAPGVRTDPSQAASFVSETNVDALAVAVGTSHAMQQRTGTVDLSLIRRLAAAVDAPLVLHGSSGVSEELLMLAVGAGITKVNVSTHLNGLFTSSVRQSLASLPAVTDPRKYIAPARQAIAHEVDHILQLLSGGVPHRDAAQVSHSGGS